MEPLKSKVMEGIKKRFGSHPNTGVLYFSKPEIDIYVRAAIREYDKMVNVKSYEENDGSDCPPIIERFSREQALAAFGVED